MASWASSLQGTQTSSVQEREVAPPRVPDPEVARRAGPAPRVAGMLEVAYSLRVACGTRSSDVGPPVAGAVVHEKELPIREGLRAHAGAALRKKPLRIKERDDYGHLGSGQGRRRRRTIRRPSPMGW